MTGRIIIGVLLAVILGVPFAMTLGRSETKISGESRRLIVVTPHVPQIREEFAHAFSRWHERIYGEPVEVDFRAPGGTSEIRKLLDASFKSKVKGLASRGGLDGDLAQPLVLPAGTIEFDLMFGGGSYDHGGLARPLRVALSESIGEVDELLVRQSAPAEFSQSELDELFGRNRIGPQQLYHPEQFWIGTALSSFGIVYNREVFGELGLDEPTGFDSLTDPRLVGWIALADPRQSGSVTTTFDSILGNQGWTQGWRTLRAMCGNTRYFTNSSTKPPIDVSQGEAAAGLAIDFYGRGQAQVIMQSGGGDRVGYTDPAGAVYVDADPVSIINGGPNPEVAQRFVRFCVSEEAQALWQFRANTESNPTVDGFQLGPEQYELRRLPVRRMMYERHFEHFVDQVNPFDIVSDVENPGWRTGVQVMMGCFGVDLAEDCRRAWEAIARAEEEGRFDAATIGALRDRFFAFPTTRIDTVTLLPGYGSLSPETKDWLGSQSIESVGDLIEQGVPGPDDDLAGTSNPIALELAQLIRGSRDLDFTEENYRTVRNEWRLPGREARLKIEYARFFREQYRSIVREVNAGSS